MFIERIEGAFSRVPNGTFSNGPAGWSGPSTVESVGGEDGSPALLLSSTSTLWANIAFRDLSLYPSIVDFDGVRVEPAGLDEVFMTAVVKYPGSLVKPFEYGTPAIPMLRGDPVFVDDTLLRVYTGEYRSEEILHVGSVSYLKVRTPSSIIPIVSRDDVGASFYARDPAQTSLFWIKVLGDLSALSRPGGGTGVRPGDGFASDTPKCSGLIQSLFYSGGETTMSVLSAAPHVVSPSTGGASMWKSFMGSWIIAPVFTGVLRRKLPVCLYDLTLAFTMKDGAGMHPGDIQLEFYDEVGEVSGVFHPEMIDSPNKYISKAIGATGYTRYILRFLFERPEPFYGSARIGFYLSGLTKIGDVAFFRGNFTERLEKFGHLSQRTFDYLEQPVARDGEIIPRGTIVAYVGGSVCPPGYIRAEGVGKIAGSLESQFISRSGTLAEKIGPFSSIMINSRYGTREHFGYSGEEPRTYLRFPVTTPLTSYIEKLYPGCILEFRPGSGTPVFAIISGASLILSTERTPDPPSYHWPPFLPPPPPSPLQFEIELVGDYKDLIDYLKTQTGDAYAWKSGVLAHVQDATELENWKDAGGYAYAGTPHEHEVKKSEDIGVVKDVGWSETDHDGNEVRAIQPYPGMLYQHEHLMVLAGASIPKIRPVLLCQKL